MAATAVNCCLNVSPPSSSPPSPLPKPVVSPWQAAARKDAGWKGRCVSTMACVILGSAVGLAGLENAAYAAVETPTVASAAAHRWSEMRECPPWHANSLENIVPENLPRPSARRRFESVGVATGSVPAVAGRSFRLAGGGCFFL